MGRHTHRSIRLGDPLRIRVKATSLEQKLLDYELVEPGISEAAGPAEDPDISDFVEQDPRPTRKPRSRKKAR